jgi:hypothetical protein
LGREAEMKLRYNIKEFKAESEAISFFQRMAIKYKLKFPIFLLLFFSDGGFSFSRLFKTAEGIRVKGEVQTESEIGELIEITHVTLADLDGNIFHSKADDDFPKSNFIGHA